MVSWNPSNWFGTSSPPTPGAAKTADGAYEAPDRNKRQECWDARDGFFACLDKAGIIDSIKDKDAAMLKCGAQLKAFEANCASSWVTYFKKRRVVELEKELALQRLEKEGADLPADIQARRPKAS
ncbi:hypothetical protein M501DRAFT_997633 [Patellaria atrata CBS 101060]|uniref:Cytochrome c oxidase assembly factor 6 n=1 Tax=Patellaria atrata CBS 101060 TaxID=1346257 RepID=A0A9P4S4J5_9PEZI|nr:hypothetical protein M501DRAFT_997633 [Patellaria atrata CBS 101060]